MKHSHKDGAPSQAASPRSVLLMAECFPPIQNSGTGRPLAFAKYLHEFGYAPVVLASEPRNGAPLDESRLGDVPHGVVVTWVAQQPWEGWRAELVNTLGPMRGPERALGLPRGELHRHVAEWAQWCAPEVNDDWTWAWPAEQAGAVLVQRHRPRLIWATGPRFGTMVAAARLSRKSGIPLVVDYRDPWTYGLLFTPPTRRLAAAMRTREARVLRRAARVVFTSPLTTQRMAALHPRHAAKFTTILNGFDDPPADMPTLRAQDRLLLRHIGVVPKRRPPEELLDALALLRREHPDIAARVRVEFVGIWDDLPAAVSHRGLADLVAFFPPVAYDESRRLMAAADVLILLPAIAESSEVIASKLFDYLAAGRPILAVSPAGSGDDWLLRSLGADWGIMARTPTHIAQAIKTFLELRQTRGILPSPSLDVAQLTSRFHRRALTRELATVFDAVLGATSGWSRFRRRA